MDAAMQKIWKAVTSLEQADTHSTALCHSIINLMINQGVVTKKEFTRQIEKSVEPLFEQWKGYSNCEIEKKFTCHLTPSLLSKDVLPGRRDNVVMKEIDRDVRVCH